MTHCHSKSVGVKEGGREGERGERGEIERGKRERGGGRE